MIYRFAALCLLMATMASSAIAQRAGAQQPVEGMYELTNDGGPVIKDATTVVIVSDPAMGLITFSIWIFYDDGTEVYLHGESGYMVPVPGGYELYAWGGSEADLTPADDGNWESEVTKGRSPGKVTTWERM